MSEPIWKLDAYEIADLVRAGKISAKEVLEVFLERIDTYNSELNAFVYLDPDRARADAADIDRRVAAGEDPGPFAGVPIGIKDLEDVAGMPTTHGSVPYKDNVPARDGVGTARIRAGGAVIVGKTHAPEFGSTAHTRTFLHGVTRNPWNLERTSGGSSGGSSSAVAAALVPIATASDGGGSTRIPASYTGLFGLKGTFGRVPKEGPESSFTSVRGCLSRSVRDTARFWDCVVGHHELDAYSLPRPGLSYAAVVDERPTGLRAAWSDDLGYGACAKEVSEIARRAAEALVEGAELKWVDRPVELKDMSAAWGFFNHAGTWLEVRDYWPERIEDFTPLIRATVRSAEERFNVREVARAIERRYENNRRLAELFEEVDVILTPTTATTAFRAEGPMPSEIDGTKIKPMHAITFTYPFNVSGHPAASLPCGFDSEGLPVGLQIVGRRHADHVVLQLSAAFEALRPWPKLATAYSE